VVLGLPGSFAPKIASAIEKASKRPSVVWLHFAMDTGCTESVIKSTYPSAAELVLDILSVDYHETIMVAAGEQSEEILQKSISEGGYICIVEGGIPTKPGYGRIGRKDMMDIMKEVGEKAAAIIAIGQCATYGGIPAASPNPAGIKGVGEFLGKQVVNLPGCPVNPDWLVATVVHNLLFGKLPELDQHGRPKFIYGTKIHDNCPRRAHFDMGIFVEEFGSKEAWEERCLYKMGCKGPNTYANCPHIRWNDKISWCVQTGYGCTGCTEPGWPDAFSPFRAALPGVVIPAFKGVENTADNIGATLAVATAAGIGVHLAASAIKGRIKKDEEKKGGEQ
jgi:NiFe hydrogenase small subunit HydA